MRATTSPHITHTNHGPTQARSCVISRGHATRLLPGSSPPMLTPSPLIAGRSSFFSGHRPTYATLQPLVSAASSNAAAAIAACELESLLSIKIGVARGTGRLDLTDMRLTEVPAEVWTITDLEVRAADWGLAGKRAAYFDWVRGGERHILCVFPCALSVCLSD